MKKQDWLVILIVVVVLAPFFIPATGFFAWFEASTKAHPFIMAFFKFAILATFGEMLALRIREGVYNKKGFGIVPRMMVWGFLGMCIAMAMIIFKSGVPAFLGVIGGCSCPAEVFAAPELTWGKVGVAFAVSVLMNTIFAPVMMTFHKCVQWNVVFKKTIPLFWFPAHTITFILPPTFQVLFAALLGVALGLILALAGGSKK